MKTKNGLLFSAALAALLLCACGSTGAEPEPTPEPAPEPQRISLVLEPGDTEKLDEYENLVYADLSGSTCYEEILAWWAEHPEVELFYTVELPGGLTADSSAKRLDLTGLEAADVPDTAKLLGFLPKLEQVELGVQEQDSSLTLSELAPLCEALPQVLFRYEFTLFGLTFSTADTEMDLSHISMKDEGAAVVEAVRCMPALQVLDMDSCGVSNEAMQAIREAFPQVKVIWRIWFGGYSVRTDAEKILASKPSMGGNLHGSTVSVLKYCTDVKYLDLGHNVYINDISFVSSMPELEVFIIAMNDLKDASPLADCKKMEYLEIQTTELTDISPLAALTELKHLNICYLFDLYDITPLYGLDNLERLWIGCTTPIPDDQVVHFKQLHPDCVVNTTTYDPTDGGWRYTGVDPETGATIRAERYDLLVDQFGYTRNEYDFAWRTK